MGHACIMGLLAGRLFGLDEKQMANALAIAGCFSLQPGVMLSPSAARNMRTPFGAYGGILSGLLAGKGFTGGLEVFEGRQGLAQVVTGGEMDLEKLKQPRKGWSILSTWVKRFAADGDMQGLLEATVTLVKRHDIAPKDVAEVRIKTNSYNYRLADPVKRRHPNNKYTADHSLYYTTAVAIVDRAVGPEQFSEQKLWDPRVRELLDKILVEPDPSLEEFSSPGIAEITTNKGEKYSCEIRHPKGHPMNPVTDADLEEKFRSMAGKFMDESQMSHIIDSIYNLENLEDIGELVKLLIFPEPNTSRYP
jgi:2-methylcitrate dehydratase